MDGLLFDSEALYRDALLAVARAQGFAFAAADFPALIGRPWSANRVTLQRHLGAGRDVEAVQAAWMREYEARRPALALKPGAAALLDRLDALRLPRAICTSSGHATVARNLRLHGLEGRFDAVIAAGDYACGKPAPDPYRAAAARLGLPAGGCLALEDSAAGIRSAAAAGMRAVMVPDLLPPDDALRRLCEAVLPDLHAVRRRWFG